MKVDVEYCLDENVRNEIIIIKNFVKSEVSEIEIFLFGSIAKGKYKKDSDIDILILIPDDKSIKELRLLRHKLEDKIDILKLSRSVDIKLYNRNRYINLANNTSFEQEIQNDLIDIRSW
ncbi:nucleotidyltransferase domain-containing protein [Clostridium gasigenes]|uniref:Nucleotidyltransferase domain-containing protein n=1 Tax=Clostridium gasigenes TaxID=94869 RepID=A0A7X0VT91_9CLOT|nr:nucleotidyltransferase domain-containing protein [Clostridium gasigenes]MBB6715351.1 nucleotidyltransferase domain-containing protein [Clostridium gasigenes]